MHIKISKLYVDLVYLIWAFTDPTVRSVDKNIESVLDLGCGNGNPVRLLLNRIKIHYLEGVEAFYPYIQEARRLGIYTKIVNKKVENISYPPKSFDLVLASHVVEHIPKKMALNLIKKMEKIAKKQVVIVTPIGQCYHPDVDHNALQFHRSSFVPDDFINLGYEVKVYGWKWLLDRFNGGLLSRINNPLLKKIIYIFNHLLTPVYDWFPWTCDYIFVATKRFK